MIKIPKISTVNSEMFCSNTRSQNNALAKMARKYTIKIPVKNFFLAVKMRRYCLSSIFIPSFFVNFGEINNLV